MLRIYTSQYRYGGADRLDITVKGNDPLGKVFAPTWDIVKDLKDEKITQKQYEELYVDLMRDSYLDYPDEWTKLLSMDEVTLVCFCKINNFCHRHLLAKILVKLGAEWKYEVKP